jgi:hypothetical protein
MTSVKCNVVLFADCSKIHPVSTVSTGFVLQQVQENGLLKRSFAAVRKYNKLAIEPAPTAYNLTTNCDNSTKHISSIGHYEIFTVSTLFSFHPHCQELMQSYLD